MYSTGASLVHKSVKNPPAILETRVQSLDQEDPVEKEMATHSGILAWRIPRTEKSGRLQYMGLQRADITERLTLSHFHFLVIVIFFLKPCLAYNLNSSI